MTDRSEGTSATAPSPARGIGKEHARQAGRGSWPRRTRILWALCAIAYGIFFVKVFWFARASTFTQWEGGAAAHGPDKIIVSFRNDDLSVYSNPGLEDSVISLFKAHGVRQTFAFIPNPSGYIGGNVEPPPGDPPIVPLLRQWEREGSIEFALHGFTHLKNNVGAGEFDGLPAETQYAMIRRGKAILDSTLGTNVRIFAPPWNQLDQHTMEACARAGVDRMSGYIGVPPAAGILPVNTNAELFFAPGDIPPVDRVLELARSGSGTRFVNVFYHSRVDFRTPEAFHRVDSLLSSLQADPRVEILTLGEIAARYAPLLWPSSASGWNIVESENAMKFAKPYLSAFAHLPLAKEKIQGLERMHQHALESYWCGDYATASVQAGSVVRQSGNWLALGRLIAPLGVGVVLGLLLLARAGRRTVLLVYAITILPVVLTLLFLAVASHVAPERVGEASRLAVVFAGGLLLALPWIPRTSQASTVHL